MLAPPLRKSLILRRFKSDRDEIWQNCSSSYASNDGVGFRIWRHTFKMAAMTLFHEEKCCHLVSKYKATARRLCSSVDSSWPLVGLRSYLLLWRITRSSAIAVIADRTACSILTLFIVIVTYRPLNKKIRLLSVRGFNNYCGSASAIRSPHTSAAPAVALFTAPSRHAVCHCWQTSRAFRLPCTRVAWIHRHLWRFSVRFLWCILWLNGTSYSKSVWRDK